MEAITSSGMVMLTNKKGEAKDYQIRQLLALVEAYGLTMKGDEPIEPDDEAAGQGTEVAEDEQQDE